MSLSIAAALQQLSQNFTAISDSPRLDAEILLMHFFKKNRAWLYSHGEEIISSSDWQRLNILSDKRKSGMPIAYIVGMKEFWSLPLKVTSDVLIPRPETECLVEYILRHHGSNKKFQVLDLGTGSGAIALALAKEKPGWHFIATDVSMSALNVAKENAQNLNITNIAFICSHWLTKVPANKFNLIISNPPYIDPQDFHLKALTFEPRQALIAEENGLADIRNIVQHANSFLEESGWLFIEHGYNQSACVKKIFGESDFRDVSSHKDLNQQWRFTTGRSSNDKKC